MRCLIPHRVSKEFSEIKTKQANKLLCETVGHRLLAEQAIAKDGACYEFNPNQEHDWWCHWDVDGRDKLIIWDFLIRILS